MSHFKQARRIVSAATLAILLLLPFFSPLTLGQSQTSNPLTLSLKTATYGNAWNGTLLFDLSGTINALVVMDTKGNVLNYRQSNSSYEAAYNIAANSILYQGEPQVDGAATAPTYATHIWNIKSNITQNFPNVISHHDIQYDPVNHTFLTLQEYVRQIGDNSILFDKIVQLDQSGNVLWSWDTYDHIPLNEADPINQTDTINGQTVVTFAHANSLDWHYKEGIIYLNLRHTNTFYKINQTNGDIIWACGQFGNFTLFSENGTTVSNLWFHSHDTKEVSPNVFTMFDNDYGNLTNTNDCYSRMIEVTLNETNMTAHVSWSWQAPKQYWTPYGGATVILPNGDRLGVFGTPSHQYPQTKPWDFNNTGAVFVEVNNTGQVVKTWTFPVGWYVYHIDCIYNYSAPQNSAFSIAAETIVIAAVFVAVAMSSIGLLLRRRKLTKRLNNHFAEIAEDKSEAQNCLFY